MKVLLVNGSPNKEGNTYKALCEVAKALNEEGIDTAIFQIGRAPISGCLACGGCKTLGKCVIDDVVNDFLEIADKYDGFVFGSPVYYASANGAMIAFMDRVFYADGNAGKKSFYLKPAASVMTARRAGTTATFDQMNKYYTISEMPIISSKYWNAVYRSPYDDKMDDEGYQVMRTLGRNMAWFLKCKEAGEKAGVKMPKREDKIATNFIN